VHKHLPHPDRIRLSAAEGWLGLGDWREAEQELESITANLRGHPEVLRIEYQVYAAAKKWELAAEAASTIIKLDPESSFGFVYTAFALHELKRTHEALNALLPVADTFPEEWVIPYNLACYTCVLGNQKAAWAWLRRAINIAGKEDIRTTALQDPDLPSLWPGISEI
jgi:predicted Zn-dependent protease